MRLSCIWFAVGLVCCGGCVGRVVLSFVVGRCWCCVLLLMCVGVFFFWLCWLCCSVRGFARAWLVARACCFVCGCCWCVFLFGGVLCCVGSSEFLCWCVAGLALGRCWSVGVFVAVLFMVLFLWSCCFWFVTILGFCCFEKSHLLVAGVWCCPLLLLFDSALVCHPCFVYGSVQHHVVSGCPCSGSCSFIHYYGSVLYFYCSCCFWFSRF